jgi:hypothetical protein
MRPTLKDSGVIHVALAIDETVETGDVIVFEATGGDHLIAHRVISVAAEGVRTRGDNSRADPWLISPGNILGKVVLAEEDGKCRRIHGGRRGQLQAIPGRLSYTVRTLLTHLLHRVTSSIAHTKFPFGKGENGHGQSTG